MEIELRDWRFDVSTRLTFSPVCRFDVLTPNSNPISVQQGAAVTGSTTLGSGLLAAGVRGVPAIGEVGAPVLARVVGVVGRVGAIGLAVAGSATLIGLLGYGGYKLFRKLNTEAQTNFAYLAQSFDEISRGIEK